MIGSKKMSPNAIANKTMKEPASVLRELSFVVPSINGKERLLLICEWLRESNFGGEYIIVDASSDNKSAHFNEFSFVKYLHRPRTDAIKATAIGMQDVETQFSAFIGDDDVPLLRGYQKCVDALLQSREYDSSHGHATYVDFDGALALSNLPLVRQLEYGIQQILAPRYDEVVQLSGEDIGERLRNIAEQYVVTQFFVTRTEVSKQLYNDVIAGIGDIHTSEYAICYAQAAVARSIYVSSLYMMRGIGRHRPNSNPTASRHKLDPSGLVEKKLEQFVSLLPIRPVQARMVYQLCLSNRYRSAFENQIGLKRKKDFGRYWLHQLQRLWFCVAYQSSERLAFIWWLKDRPNG